MSAGFVFLTIPVIVVWLVVLLDIAVRGDLRVWGKLAWLAAVTLLWPMMILYLLLRPVDGRLQSDAAVRRRKPDPHQRLVVAVLDHEAGLSTEAEYRTIKDGLRHGSAP